MPSAIFRVFSQCLMRLGCIRIGETGVWRTHRRGKVYGLEADPTVLEDARVDRFREIIVPEAAKTCPYLIFPQKPPSGQRVWNPTGGFRRIFSSIQHLGKSISICDAMITKRSRTSIFDNVIRNIPMPEDYHRPNTCQLSASHNIAFRRQCGRFAKFDHVAVESIESLHLATMARSTPWAQDCCSSSFDLPAALGNHLFLSAKRDAGMECISGAFSRGVRSRNDFALSVRACFGGPSARRRVFAFPTDPCCKRRQRLGCCS